METTQIIALLAGSSAVRELLVSPDAPGLEVNASDTTPVRGSAVAGWRAQAFMIIAVVGVSLMAGGLAAGGSALFGAGVAWVTWFYASKRASVPERSAAAALSRVMVGEFIKVVGTIALFAVAARVPHMVWPAMLCGYVAALIATWLQWMGTDAGRNRLERAAPLPRG